MQPPKQPQHTCGGCDNTWTGYAQCHCTQCHRTFGGIKGFDRHRYQGECRDPATYGYVIGARGVWSEPFSWAREGEDHSANVLAAFAHQHHREHPTITTTSIYNDPTTSRTIYVPAPDENPAYLQAAFDNATKRGVTRRPTRDDFAAWLRHGHEDTGWPGKD